MIGCPEFKYWIKDNAKLELKDEMLPAWIATIRALESLIPEIERQYPELGRDIEDQDTE